MFSKLPTPRIAPGKRLIDWEKILNSGSHLDTQNLTDISTVDIKPGEALAVRLLPGQEFMIEDIYGTQVGDLVAFMAQDYTERFSPGNTRKLNHAWLITTGDILYSTKCRPLLTIVEDSVGRNDLLFSSCSPYDYPLRFGVDGHSSCLAALSTALVPYDIPEYLIPDPLNIFQNTSLDVGSGAMATVPPRSVAGSRMRLRAEVECLIALSSCPQDLNPCNGGTPTALRVQFPGMSSSAAHSKN